MTDPLMCNKDLDVTPLQFRKKVLMTDRAWPYMLEVIQDLSRICARDDIDILFLTERHKSGIEGNLEIINIFETPQKKTIDELQRGYDFSLYKCIVTERSYTDYSSFRDDQLYSRLKYSEIQQWLCLYANAFDYIADHKNVDVLIENAPDCFIPSLGGRIFKSKGKLYYSIHISYWHSNGIMFFDGIDWTSSHINDYYKKYIAAPELIDRHRLDQIYQSKKTLFRERLPQRLVRIKTILNRVNSYNPPSIKNWLSRKVSLLISSIHIKLFAKRLSIIPSEKFVLFPLHVTPEASLLGTTPELADQFSLIKNISMNLPWGIKLYVKEHPHSLIGGGLDYSFYKKVVSLLNVEIIKYNVPLDDLVKSKNLVCLMGLSGTACLEAALLRKPVIIFGNPYFKIADCFIKISAFDELHTVITNLVKSPRNDTETHLYSILAAIDASVVVAEKVDFTKCKTTLDMAMSYNPIIRKFIKHMQV
jgi:hypothetical protein